MRPFFMATGAALIALCAFQTQSAGAGRGRTAVERDVEGYAIASCLARQKEPYLSDQGHAWIDVIVQRSHGDIEHFKPVADAVEAQAAKEPMPMTRQESGPSHAKAVPVLLCAELIDEPPVRAAIDEAIKKLAPAYRRSPNR